MLEMNLQHVARISLALAQTGAADAGSSVLLNQLTSVALFSVVGIIVLVVCLVLMELLTPYSIVKEIIDEHNIALAVVMGSVVIGMSLIIAASVSG